MVTHQARQPLVKNGGTTFTFVADGIESALAQAKAAAGDKDVSIAGDAQIIQHYLQAGLLDELHIGIAPVLLGAGLRLFEHLGTEPLDLEQMQTVEAAGVMHLRYRIHKPA